MINPTASIRIARPSNDLTAAERFYAGGLGLDVLFRRADEHQLLMLGWRGASWHLELCAGTAASPQPTDEDLLVIYLDGEIDPALLARLENAGGRRVKAANPYWDEWGVTIADPDGYRLVLSRRSWSNAQV